MGLDFALEKLYETGWSAMDTAGCEPGPGGRWAPGLERIRRELRELGYAVTVDHVAGFDCYRAEYANDAGEVIGSVVGSTAHEAGVYALAQARRSMVGVA